ncbi:MAG TPA: wax ester/triacylglycerol synthase family O-acyltransferase [Steroidobacteraceae bacterium]
MRQLRGEDARFVYAETGHANSNITLLSIYDPSTAPEGRVRFKGLLKHIESRLHLSPIFRQKLLRVPLDLDHPYWIEDEGFDLEYHVRHIALPKPGDWRQFCIQASRIHARPLDLSKPLWEIYLVEGLDAFLDLPQDSFGILAKVHHAAIDVRGGAEITTLLHDTTATPPPREPPEPWFPESPPGAISLLARAALHNLVQPLMVAAPLTRALRNVAPAVLGALGDLWLHPERLPITRFNSEVSPHRVFESRRFPIEEFKLIRELVPGATINDAVLAVCGGALRRYLLSHDELPGPSLVSIAPVSIRNSEGGGNGSHNLSLMRVPLGTELEDPVRRLRSIQHHTAADEDIGQAIGAKELTDITKHAPAATLALSARVLAGSSLGMGQRAPFASCTITNVPGPAIPLYLNGARMTYFSAIMPISDGMGLVFSVTSYDGMLLISPTSCREQIPDPEYFAQCIRDSFQEYLAIARRPVRRNGKRKAKLARGAKTKKVAKGKVATKRRAA